MSIYVSGSVAFDRIMDFPGKFSDHILPDKIHILNVCFTINGLKENFGGTAGNIAYSLALLGEIPYIIAAAGEDFDRYRSWLEEKGLPLDHIDVIEGEFTAGAYITTDQSDNQITAFNPGAMGRRSRFDPSQDASKEGLAIIAPGNLDDMQAFAAAYREMDIPYIFDPGQSTPIWTPEGLVKAIDGADILISNDYELELIREKTGLDTPALLTMAGHIITTKGEEGSDVRHLEKKNEVITHIPPAAPLEICDPTGAGDAYRAGLIKGLRLPGRDILHGARMGSVASAYAVEVYGTQTFGYTEDDFNSRYEETFGERAF